MTSDSLYDRATATARSRDYESALPLFGQLAEREPENAAAHHNLGIVLETLGRFRDAEESYARAVAIAPEVAEMRRARGIARLRLGRWTEGWADFEWRFKTADYAGHQPPLAAKWDGSPAPRATLFVHTEQGLGDALQFARYLPAARERVGRVVLGCPPSLTRVMRTVAGVDAVMAWGDPMPPAGLHCPILSLPHALGLAGPEPFKPYLKTPVSWPETRRVRPRIGLVWQGSPVHGNDWARSVPVEDLAPLTGLSGFDWIGLQVGTDAPDGMADWASRLADFADTGAAVRALDLLITVDTAAAHLAGALRRPVWILLPRNSDWRWGESGESTPWYPTARLFRQGPDGAWGPVVERLVDAVKGFPPPV